MSVCANMADARCFILTEVKRKEISHAASPAAARCCCCCCSSWQFAFHFSSLDLSLLLWGRNIPDTRIQFRANRALFLQCGEEGIQHQQVKLSPALWWSTPVEELLSSSFKRATTQHLLLFRCCANPPPSHVHLLSTKWVRRQTMERWISQKGFF